MFNIGDRIKQLRLKQNMTQTELAIAINKRQESINRMENGKYNPSYEVLYEICNVFGITLADFFTDEGEETPSELAQLIKITKDLTPDQLIHLGQTAKLFAEQNTLIKKLLDDVQGQG